LYNIEQGGEVMVNIELQRVWNEVVIAYLKTLLQYLPEEHNEIQEITCLDIQ
jgi:hypothetical protein